jgi:hypothetical protein
VSRIEPWGSGLFLLAADGRSAPTTAGVVVSRVDSVAANVSPTIFGCQFLLELRSPTAAAD